MNFIFDLSVMVFKTFFYRDLETIIKGEKSIIRELVLVQFL